MLKIFSKGIYKIKDATDNLIFKCKDRVALNNTGMGVVEIILIILVLVGLALIFRSKITQIVNQIFVKMTSKINSF